MIYLDEANPDGGTPAGGGAVSEADLNIDIGTASDSIGADLFGKDVPGGKDDQGGELEDSAADSASSPPADESKASPPADKAAAEAKARAEKAGKVAAARTKLTAEKQDFTGKTDDEILAMAAPATRAAPKSWKKELHEVFAKLPPEAQAYIEQREAQVEEGFKQYGETVKYGETMKAALQPYEALLTAQGVKDPTYALKTLMNAHYILSTEQPAGRAKFMAQLLNNYGVDLQALTEAVGERASVGEEPAAVRELRARTERLENDRRSELQGRVSAVKAQTAAEVEAFASDPKHPYFNEVAREITLLLQDPNVSLEQAYEQAVWANPVTRGKENARLKTEAEAKAKEDAEKAAAAAIKARGTRVRSNVEGPVSPDFLGSMEDTMRKTFREIKDRQDT